MSSHFIITGTDTGIGKTVVSAMLTQALGATYWKPLQSGVEGGVDTKAVQKMTGLPSERFLSEKYVFTEPLSPHRAAELDNMEVDVDSLTIPDTEQRLIIEGAGGLMVPLTRKNLLINVFKSWHVPVILVARTGLGTINHTLLSLEALWSRKIPVHGIIFVGEENDDNIKTIHQFSDTKVLGRLPMLDSLNTESLASAFDQNFKLEDFTR
ncbi:MAG: ATP-dependent dethiobiotin synthetase BioD [Alphaproteobacteria bacterium]|nr:ATP-dependent dethiobiotin synthetase BioD [Alphaproteobacteria bacterium]